MEVVEVFESLLLELGFIVANWEKEVYVSVLLGFFSAGGGIPENSFSIIMCVIISIEKLRFS